MLILTCLKVSIMFCIFSHCFPKWEVALKRFGNGALGSYGISEVRVDDADASMLTCLPLVLMHSLWGLKLLLLLFFHMIVYQSSTSQCGNSLNLLQMRSASFYHV